MINEAFCAVFHNLTLTHCPAVKANFSRSLGFVFKAFFWRASPTSGAILYVQEAPIFWLHLFFFANFELCTEFHLMKIRMYFFFGCLLAIKRQCIALTQKMTHTSPNSYLGKEKNISRHFFGDEQKTMIQSSFYPQQIGLFFGNI